MTAYYNEIDPHAADWLRNLIAAGHVAPGDVDTRSIEDVAPDDLRPYRQCHFFAGIGVWSYALRLADWPDDREVWTGSCPCQPFSAAGKGGGFADERHLWPAWFHLIGERRPGAVFGEQVASKDGLGWLDLVQADLEGAGYACGPVDLCAAGVGAPHIRQRLWFVGHPDQGGGGRHTGAVSGAQGEAGRGLRRLADRAEPASAARVVADADGRDASAERQQPGGQHRQQQEDSRVGQLADALRDGAEHRPGSGPGPQAAPDRGDRDLPGQRLRLGIEGAASVLAQSASIRLPAGAREPCVSIQQIEPQRPRRAGVALGGTSSARLEGCDLRALGLERPAAERAGPVGGFWADADWIPCRDGKARPVEPGTFPLAHGAPARVGRLRAYGNAIVAEAAAAVIRAYDEAVLFL